MSYSIAYMVAQLVEGVELRDGRLGAALKVQELTVW